MNTLSRIALTALLLLMSVGSLTTPIAAMDSGTQHWESQLTGSVLEMTNAEHIEPVDEVFTQSPSSLIYKKERMGFTVPSGFFAVTFYTGTPILSPTGLQAQELGPDSSYSVDYVDILGTEVTDNSMWYLVRVFTFGSDEDIAYGEYHLDIGNGTTVYIFINTLESAMPEAIAWIQDNVTVDGYPILTQAQDIDLQAMMDGTSGIEPKRVWSMQSTVEDWEGVGLVSETEWNAPGFDAVVTWDPQSVAFPFHYSRAIDSGTYPGITLHSVDPAAFNYIYFTELSDSPGRTDLLEYQLQRRLTRVYASNWYYDYPSVSHKIENNAFSVIHTQTTIYGTDVVHITTMWKLSNGAWVVVSTRGHKADVADSYSQFMSAVEINGEAPPVLWSHDELEVMFPAADERASSKIDHAATNKGLMDIRRSLNATNESVYKLWKSHNWP